MSRPEANPQQERGGDHIVRFFTERIMAGELQPGEKLPSEAQLTTQFEVSRTVVREAIQQMKAMGMVETVNGKGSFIAKGRMEHFKASLRLYSSHADEFRDWMDLLAMRSLIEQECTRELAESGDKTGLQDLAQSLDRMRRATGDLTEFARADIDFHHAIVSASTNQLFVAVWSSLKEMSTRFALDTYRSPGQLTENLREHEDIYQAITDQSAELAVRSMKNHLARSRDNLKKLYSNKACRREHTARS